MDRQNIAQELSQKTNTKIVLLVLDGLGGLPQKGKTELESARTPHLDRLAAESVCGVTDPVAPGITPGSGPAHLSLFGYEPTKYVLGRGILEALGVDIPVGSRDMVARGNFATHKDGRITDRRAGRIPTEYNASLCRKINEALEPIENIRITLYPGREHRFVVLFSGDGLSDLLSDADPQKEDKAPVPTEALAEEARDTAAVVNSFIARAAEILHDDTKANAILLRGFSKYPMVPTIEEQFKLKTAAIAQYPMYRGLAKLAGMEILDAGSETRDLFTALRSSFSSYDFFYIHFKKTDSAGEDGAFQRKVEAIEEIDSFIPEILELSPEVLAVTSDHSTPSLLKGHSWHPNPLLIRSSCAMQDDVAQFSERKCAHGFLGRFRAVHVMPLLMAHAGKLKKFGA